MVIRAGEFNRILIIPVTRAIASQLDPVNILLFLLEETCHLYCRCFISKKKFPKIGLLLEDTKKQVSVNL